MAENKKSFVSYCDWGDTFDELSNEEAGKLVKHLFDYVRDRNPESSDQLTKMMFIPIKQSLKRDLSKYKDKLGKSSISGVEGNLKRWHKDIYNDYKKGDLTLDEAVELSKNKKVSPPDKKVSPPDTFIAVSVNDSVSDNVSVNDINNKINFKKLVLYINKKTGRGFKVINQSIKYKYKARLKEGYSNQDIHDAINNSVKADYHKESNFKYLTPEFFSRSTILDKYSNTKNSKSENNKETMDERIERITQEAKER